VKKLLETLARLGAAELAAFLGESTVSLLELLGLKHLQASRLAELVLTQTGPEDLLLDNACRRELTDALTREDAERLCRLVGLSPLPDAWTALRQQTFPKGNSAMQTLFGFFGYSPPVEEDQRDQPRPSIVVDPEYGLFPHQIAACRECTAFLMQGQRPRVLLHMPTGAGKTRTAMNVLAHFFRDRLDHSCLVLKQAKNITPPRLCGSG